MWSQAIPRSEANVAKVELCGGGERSQGPKVWSADTRGGMHNSPHVLRTLFPLVPWYRHFSIVDTHVNLFHRPCFGTGHSRRFRRTSNQSMPDHPYWLKIKYFKKKIRVQASLNDFGSFLQLVFQREHPRRCRRPRQVAAAVSH